MKRKLSNSTSTMRFVEIAIRIVAVVTCAGAVVAAGISIDKILDINNCCTATIGGIINVRIEAGPLIDAQNPDIRKRTEATAAVAIIGGLIIPLGILMIILRLFKMKLGAFGRILVIADLLLTLLAICAFGVAGVLGAVTAKDWTEDFVDVLSQIFGSNSDTVAPDITDIRNDMAATAACSLLACGSCGLLFVFIIVLLVRHNRLDYIGL